MWPENCQKQSNSCMQKLKLQEANNQKISRGIFKMESIERKIENYAVVFNVNLLRATLVEATEFRDLLDETISENRKDIIVNLAACEHLDSTFLGVLVSCYKRLKSQNRTLVIIEPIEQSSIFLTLNSIGKIFPLYTSVKVALEDIENKKLLEKELGELSGEKSRRHESPAENAAPVETSIFADSPLVQRQEEALNLEPSSPESINKPEPEVMHTAESTSEIQLNYALSDNVDNENVLKTDTIKINSLPQMPVLPIEESGEENFVQSTQTIIRPQKNFHSGRVEWEFGFSS